jgi:hypothetical protein
LSDVHHHQEAAVLLAVTLVLPEHPHPLWAGTRQTAEGI